MAFGIIFSLAIAVVYFIAMWKVFSKAGKPGWAILVPIYNILVFLQVIGKPWWWLLLMCIPGVNFVFMIWAMNLLSLSYGKDTGFTVGLLLLSPVFILILGLGAAEYKGPAGEVKAA